MGANTKTLRNRIKSVNSTLHLTKAMGLVASSKIRRAMEGMQKGRQYEQAVKQTIDALTLSPECKKSPYMQRYDGGKTCLVVIAGDRGLAGGYNANIFRSLKEFGDVEIIPIGKRACDRAKKDIVIAEKYDYSEAIVTAKELCEKYESGEYEKIGVLCTRYISMLSQEPQVKWIFPLDTGDNEKSTGMIFEPDELTILNTAVPEYVAGVLVSSARESFACEVSARRTAMDSAGKNAQQMIDDLQLEYNRARQGAITQEITEIVAGSGV